MISDPLLQYSIRKGAPKSRLLLLLLLARMHEKEKGKGMDFTNDLNNVKRICFYHVGRLVNFMPVFLVIPPPLPSSD